MLMSDNFIETFFTEYAVWYVLAYSAVFLSMVIDLAVGLIKARRLGFLLTSRGYKRTCDKALKYFAPMLCLSAVDIIASVVFSFPLFTIVYGGYNVFCETVSVFETTRDKSEIFRMTAAMRRLMPENEALERILAAFIDATRADSNSTGNSNLQKTSENEKN